MAIEKRWAEVPQQLFAADGTEGGVITVADTAGYYVKRRLAVNAVGEPELRVEVKRVLSPTQIVVGPVGKNLQTNIDLSNYTTAKIAAVHATEDKRPEIPQVDYVRAVYDEEPVVAWRTVGVDKYGRDWDYTNPLPVSVEESANPTPTTEKIAVVDIDKTNIVEFTFPVDCDSYKVRVRDANDKMKLAFNNGDIGNDNYYTIDMGWEYESPKNKNFQSGKKLYMQGFYKNNSKVEIIYYY